MKYRAFFLLLLSMPAFTSQYNMTGYIHTLRDNSMTDDADFLMIENGESAGSCKTHDGLVVIRIPDTDAASRAFSIALSAQISGKQVFVNFDDSIKGVGGHCLLRYINILPNE